MRNFHISIFFMVAGTCALICSSCSTCSRQQTAREITVDIADLAIDSTYIGMARKVFYSLPTPIEISMLIKNSGVAYQASLLNDPASASKYLTNTKMAVNFGVYITDLTYAGLFEQRQTVLRYKQTIQKLTEGLGIQSAIDNSLLQRLEANLNDKEELLRIIAETYASCTAYLDEDDRYFLTLSMLAGGWIEGMYIATCMTDENLIMTEDRMKQLVIDQKFTFDMMWQVLSNLKNIPEIAGLMSELSGLAQIFDTITIDQTSNVVSHNQDDNVSEISAKTAVDITPKTFADIKEQIQIIRHNFTKK
jgi:hypothetical protein